MKRLIILLTLLVSTAAASLTHARTISYRGFADIAGGAPVNLAISTTHGIQFSSKYFLGMGLEYNCYQSDPYFSDGLGIFLRNRFDFTNGKRWNAFVEAAPGYSIGFDFSGEKGLMLNACAGVRCALTHRVGINFGLTFSFYGSRDVVYISTWDFEYNGITMLGARVGIDF